MTDNKKNNKIRLDTAGGHKWDKLGRLKEVTLKMPPRGPASTVTFPFMARDSRVLWNLCIPSIHHISEVIVKFDYEEQEKKEKSKRGVVHPFPLACEVPRPKSNLGLPLGDQTKNEEEK